MLAAWCWVVGVALLAGIRLTVGDSSFLALLAVLASSLSWAMGVIISPKVKLPSDALGRTAIPLVCGAALLLVAAGIAGEFQEIELRLISWKSFLGLAYLIVFGSIIAFTSYTWLLQRCPPALVATHTYANPLVAMLLGWLVASEPLTIRVVMASAVILAAIVLVRRGERSSVPRAPEIIAVAAETEPTALPGPNVQPALTGNDRLQG